MRDDPELIKAIYDTSLNTDSLPDVMQQICERVGAHGSVIFDCTTMGGTRTAGVLHISSIYDPAVMLSYLDKYNAEEIADQDTLAHLSSTGNEVNLIHDKLLFGKDRKPGANVAAMERRQVAARYGALLNKDSWNTDRFAFQYLKGMELPDADTLLWAEGMLSHLAKSLSIGRVLSGKRWLEVALTQYLEKLPVGVAVVSNDGRLIYANSELQRIAQDWPEVDLGRDGKLSFGQTDEAGQIHALMSEDAAHGKFGARPRREAVFLANPANDSGLFLEICPIESHPELENFGKGARLVSILDSSINQQIDPDIVARFFPLSKSEVAVLDLLSNGYSNTQIAEMRSRSVETVNSQIKSLLRKTNARNRTEVVKIAVGLSAYGTAKDQAAR